MRDFIFILTSLPMILEPKEGLDVVPSYRVEAHSLSEAIVVLARFLATRGHSSDPEDYQKDIDDGNIEVVLPTTLS